MVTSVPVDVAQVLHQSRKEIIVEEEEAKQRNLTVWQLPSCYMKLSKSRLSGLSWAC